MGDVGVYFLVGSGCLVLGIVIGWVVREQVAMRKVNKMFEQMDKEAQEAKKPDASNAIKAKLEVHHGHFYLFNSDTDAFLAQGETAEELSEMLRDKFPKTVFILTKEAYAELGVSHESI